MIYFSEEMMSLLIEQINSKCFEVSIKYVTWMFKVEFEIFFMKSENENAIRIRKEKFMMMESKTIFCG